MPTVGIGPVEALLELAARSEDASRGEVAARWIGVEPAFGVFAEGIEEGVGGLNPETHGCC